MAYIVVTGANGFIGTNLVDKILKLDPKEFGIVQPRLTKFQSESDPHLEVIAVIASDLSTSLTRSTAQRFLQSSRMTFVMHTELEASLRALPEKPIAIIHNGACSSTVETDPEVFSTLNLEYSKMIWRVASDLKIPLIYASSAAVYGDGTQGFSDKKEDCSKYTALNLYGKSKLDFDLWALEQTDTPPTWFGLRYFNVFGPFEAHKQGQASMVYHGYQQATRTGKIKLFQSNAAEYPDGGQKRDFVYVKDIISITIELMKMAQTRQKNPDEKPISGNGLFLNIGRGQPETWNELMKTVFDALGMRANIEYIPLPEALAQQYQNYTCADLSSLRSLGITHEFWDMRAAVKDYVLKYLLRNL